MTDGADGFLSRWSRRKQRARTEEEAGPEPSEGARREDRNASPAETLPGEEEVGVVEKAEDDNESEAEVLARLGLPDPDTLGKGDDFSGFMQTGVPEFIKRKALRRLWRSNPTLAVLDGLNDYDDDFTGGFVPPGTLKSLYEVGKGFAAKAVEDVQDIASGRADEESGRKKSGSREIEDTGQPGGAEGLKSDAGESPRSEPQTKDSKDNMDLLSEDREGSDAETRATRRRMTFKLPEA